MRVKPQCHGKFIPESNSKTRGRKCVCSTLIGSPDYCAALHTVCSVPSRELNGLLPIERDNFACSICGDSRTSRLSAIVDSPIAAARPLTAKVVAYRSITTDSGSRRRFTQLEFKKTLSDSCCALNSFEVQYSTVGGSRQSLSSEGYAHNFCRMHGALAGTPDSNATATANANANANFCCIHWCRVLLKLDDADIILPVEHPSLLKGPELLYLCREVT